MIQHKKPVTKRMLKRAARARREHGIALLFTLCILSMALIVAMIFSSGASTTRKVAAAYVDTSSARILADGIVSRAMMALMQSENASYVCSNYNTSKPKNSNISEYASDWIWKLERSGLFEFNNGPLRFRNTAYYDVNDSRCPSWEYITTKNAYGDPNNSTERIFGRYAYVAIGQNDQLNPNGIGRKGSKYYSDYNDDVFRKRLGRWTSELDFNFESTRNNWNYEGIVNPTNIQSKYSSMSDNWDDIDLFANDLAGGGSATPTGPAALEKQLKMMVDQYFDLNGQGEYNKYRPDGAAIGDLSKHELASGEEYRFPLIRNDWNSIDVNTLRNAIPWFRNAASGINVNQTVANLINYNAPESRQAVSEGDWYNGEVSYTGNKRTPYINEVHAEVTVGANLGFPMKEPYTVGDPPNAVRKWRLWYTDCTFNHEITLNIETVNIYSNPLSVRNPIPIGEISYEYLDPLTGAPVPQVIRFDAGSQPWGAPTVTTSGNYTVYTYMIDNGSVGSVTTPKREGYDRPIGHDADFYQYLKVRNIKVSLDRVILQDNYGNADLALMPSQLQTGRTFTEEIVVAGAGDFGKHVWFDTQINDPRYNLARNLWSNPSFTEADDTNATLGAFNSTVNYNKNDPNNFDPGEDPENNKISTAYIRHGQMESLWELGAIHRGAPWQTINLKCASKNGTRMEAYQNGDGHLLDQIALASSTDRATDSMLGLINLNCVASFGGGSAPFTFKSLFTNFPVYQTFENLAKSGDSGKVSVIQGKSIDSEDSDADAYASDLSEAVTYALANGNLPRRTAVFPTSYPASGSQMDRIIKRNVPDAEAEEVFCRVVNLLKWNKQPLKRATILVLAQTIKDVGGNVQLERVLSDKDVDVWRDSGFQAYDNSNKKTNPSSVSPTTIRSTYGKRTVDLKQYDNFYDQITGEAKLIVRLEWDESANENKGAWKVTRKEYAE